LTALIIGLACSYGNGSASLSIITGVYQFEKHKWLETVTAFEVLFMLFTKAEIH